MKIGILQLNPVIGDIQKNTKKILDQALGAFEKGARLCITPELSLTGYPPRDLLLYPHYIKKCEEKILAISRQIPDQCGLVIGLPAKNSKDLGRPLFNSAFLITRKKIRKIYSKKLLPNYDVFDEERYFEPGDEDGFFEFNGLKFYLTICEDAWFEPKIDGLSRYHQNPLDNLKPCDLIINISASPFYAGKQKVRETLFKSIARRHKTPFLFVNQTGANDDLLFDGQSCLVNQKGTTLQRLGSFEEKTIIFDLKKPDLRKIPDLKKAEEEIVLALTCGIKDYINKLGFKSVLIGLSGGIDSALTAVLASQALGAKNVTGILMPSPYSSQGSIDDALKLANNLKIKTHLIPINSLMESYHGLLKKPLNNNIEGLTEENLQSRIRGNILMALSNKLGALVLTTSNKSELATGYGTIYGDMAGSLCVLGDVYKTWVYKLSHWYNKNVRNVIPKETLMKAPSAELKPNQTDQDSLPPYDVLDSILEQMIEKRKTADEVIKLGFDQATVLKVEKLFHLAEFKRKQAPIILKISERAFGSGWKMPVVAK